MFHAVMKSGYDAQNNQLVERLARTRVEVGRVLETARHIEVNGEIPRMIIREESTGRNRGSTLKSFAFDHLDPRLETSLALPPTMRVPLDQ